MSDVFEEGSYWNIGIGLVIRMVVEEMDLVIGSL